MILQGSQLRLTSTLGISLLTFLLVHTEAPVFAETVTSSPTNTIAQATDQSTLYVSPSFGNDAANAGSETTPYRTITYALRQAAPGTTIRLAAGSYTKDTGEVFPLVVPAGVTLQGDENSTGQTIAIIGGGSYVSPTFASQNVAILAGKDSTIRGVTVRNPNIRGTGIWVESTNAVIKNSTFTDNHREGIFITGAATPVVESNVFTKNGGNGISVARNAKGEIRGNLFQNTGFGLAIGGNSSPIVANNRIVENVDGIYVNDSARPTLRNNVIESNTRDGIVATVNAQPDLGNAQEAGNNTIQNNRQYDVHNATTNMLYAVGNISATQKLSGQVEFVASGVEQPGQSAFRDVQGHWAQNYIEALAKRNIITGFPDGTFRPGDPVTRVQFAAIVNKAFAPRPRQPRSEFKDVPSKFWGYQAIQSAAQGGFMRGYPGGIFNPNQPIPRVQVLVSLVNGLGLSGNNSSIVSVYADATTIPAYATDAVAAATQRQIVVNYPVVSSLNPNREATRAEVAAFVYQALVNAGRAEAIPSPYLVQLPGSL